MQEREIVSFNVHNLAKEAVDFLMPSICQKSIRFEFSCTKNHGSCSLKDKINIYAVILNLMTHSIKFTGENGHISLQIQLIKLNDIDEKMEILIHDMGNDLKQEDIETNYDLYSQLMSNNNEISDLKNCIKDKILQLTQNLAGEVEFSGKMGASSSCRVTLCLPGA